ncbi:hypothetical protein M758_9G151500 [Ceratodon purpureus]|nr:hypothetical protein M758_9G151500 [Ceratodon purpureus]
MESPRQSQTQRGTSNKPQKQTGTKHASQPCLRVRVRHSFLVLKLPSPPPSRILSSTQQKQGATRGDDEEFVTQLQTPALSLTLALTQYPNPSSLPFRPQPTLSLSSSALA